MDSELRRLIEEAREKTDLVDLISQSYALDGAGGHYWRAVDHDSLVVDGEKQHWYWNSRGEQGDALDWLTMQQGMTFRDALDFLLGRPTGNREANRVTPEQIIKPPKNLVMEAEEYHQVLLSSKSTVALLQCQRNLRLATILCAKLGWQPTMKGWTIPHWRQGNTDYCAGIKVRVMWHGKARYVSVKGSRFGLYVPPPLPSLDPSMLFVVEGEFKVLSLMQVGAYAVGCPAGAFRPQWAANLSRFGQAVFVWRDNDMGGLKFVAAVREAMPHAVVLAPPIDYKGVDDFVASAGAITLQQLIEVGAQSV